MNILVVALVVCFSFAVNCADEGAPGCIGLANVSKNPAECCKYPKLAMSPEAMKTCGDECKKGEAKDADAKKEMHCCFRKCMGRESGVFVDGKFNPEKLLESFSDSADKKPLSDDWKEIVKKSVEKCQADSEFILRRNCDRQLTNFSHRSC